MLSYKLFFINAGLNYTNIDQQKRFLFHRLQKLNLILKFYLLGIVGEIEDDSILIWTHKKLEIGYNNNQIVDINLTSMKKEKLMPNSKLSFTYEVVSSWL